MRHRNGETVTITREGAPTGSVDEQGNPILSPPTTFDVAGAALAPGSGVSGVAASQELTEPYGARVVTGYVLYLPPDTELFASDRITIRGVPGWQVEGESVATTWQNPFDGGARGVVVAVRRAS